MIAIASLSSSFQRVRVNSRQVSGNSEERAIGQSQPEKRSTETRSTRPAYAAIPQTRGETATNMGPADSEQAQVTRSARPVRTGRGWRVSLA